MYIASKKFTRYTNCLPKAKVYKPCTLAKFQKSFTRYAENLHFPPENKLDCFFFFSFYDFWWSAAEKALNQWQITSYSGFRRWNASTTTKGYIYNLKDKSFSFFKAYKTNILNFLLLKVWRTRKNLSYFNIYFRFVLDRSGTYQPFQSGTVTWKSEGRRVWLWNYPTRDCNKNSGVQ